MDLTTLGRTLLALAAVLAVLGLLLIAVGKGLVPRLPGDLVLGGKNVRVFIPIGTSILLSLVLTVLLNLFFRR